MERGSSSVAVTKSNKTAIISNSVKDDSSKRTLPRRIKKRDGRLVTFKAEKITHALEKALSATGEGTLKDARRLTTKVVSLLKKDLAKKSKESGRTHIPTVEEIQDLVEKTLMLLDYEATAKAYILYREQRRSSRDASEALDRAVKLIDDYLDNMDWKTKENANMTYSLQGLNNYISSAVSTKYWMNNIYPQEIREAHVSGDFHVHDLQLLAAYCCGWDLQDLLRRGFTGVPGKVACAPAKHLGAALGQAVNFIYTMQGEAAGAQAFSSFDTLLAPFVRYDKLSYAQVKQEIQSFVFNMNVSTRVGFQTPFSNITLDLVPPKTLGKEHVIIGGEPQKETYAEFQKEMDMINCAFAEVMSEGDANGRLFTFPIPTYNLTKNFPWDDKRLEPVWNMTGKYGIPYFANFINSEMDPDDARSMCCRLRLDNRELRRRGGGLFGASPLTGSLGVVTINLPRLGFLSKDLKEFYKRLDHLMDLAQESLEIKRKVVESLTDKGLYPYTQFYLDSVKKRFGQYWNNHFSTIGLVGMNEALVNLIGEDITSKKGHAMAKDILTHMRERLQKYQEETGKLYNLEATPAEGTAYRLALLDKNRYPNIVVANEDQLDSSQSDPYYTNSTHLPVGHTNDIFEALDLQDDLQTQYTGGTVLHGFLGERLSDPKTVKLLVRRIAENYSLPYFTLSPTFSVCPTHGYLAGEQPVCPHCKEEQPTEVYSRIVGYLRPVEQWNKGKRAEFENRKEYIPQHSR